MILARLEKEYRLERRKVTALGKGEVETGPDEVENPLLRRIVLIRGDMVDRPGAKVTTTASAANPPNTNHAMKHASSFSQRRDLAGSRG
ncbi:MAG: hypothetical protein R3F31_25585 [Verrucomicrobiales bacterium]